MATRLLRASIDTRVPELSNRLQGRVSIG